MQHRAYSVLALKSVNEATREFVGIASTPTPDRVGDIVEPRGAEYTLPLPLLWQHDSNRPVGNVIKAKATNAGIEVLARMAKTDEPGTLKDRLDEAWQSIKTQLVRGLSIGFKITEATPLPDGSGLRIRRWEWLELSAVTIPANAECTVTLVKHYDRAQRAAAQNRHRGPVRLIGSGGRNADGSIQLLRSAGR